MSDNVYWQQMSIQCQLKKDLSHFKNSFLKPEAFQFSIIVPCREGWANLI